jgi:hypothetical protein
VFVPPGVAHAFAALTDMTITYLVDSYYDPEDEFEVVWDDPSIAADWGVTGPRRGGSSLPPSDAAFRAVPLSAVLRSALRGFGAFGASIGVSCPPPAVHLWRQSGSVGVSERRSHALPSVVHRRRCTCDINRGAAVVWPGIGVSVVHRHGRRALTGDRRRRRRTIDGPKRTSTHATRRSLMIWW